MKDVIGKLIANLHWLIIGYSVFLLIGLYDEHSVLLEGIETQFPTVANEIQKTQNRVQEITEFKKRREESEFRVQEVEKNIIEVQRRLPETILDNEILAFFNTEISLLGIKDQSISPGQESIAPFYISKTFNLKARGTFLQFLVFLERIGEASRIYNVKSLKFNVINDNQKGRFQIISTESVIEAFRYNPDFKVNSIEVPAETSTQAPAP